MDDRTQAWFGRRTSRWQDWPQDRLASRFGFSAGPPTGTTASALTNVPARFSAGRAGTGGYRASRKAMTARTRWWVSRVAGTPSLLKMRLMCFSTALCVIHRVLAIPALD